MSLRNFQSALAGLYLKSSFRKKFRAHPAAALRKHYLTARELRALSRIDRCKLDAFCEGLAVKNSSRLRAVFEHTAGLLGKRFRVLCHDYGDRHSDLREWPERLEAFAALLFCALQGGGLPPHARELARFEYIVAMLNHWLDRGLDGAMAKNIGLAPVRRRLLRANGNNTRLRRAFVGRFSCDVLKVLRKGKGGGRRNVDKAVAILFTQCAK